MIVEVKSQEVDYQRAEELHIDGERRLSARDLAEDAPEDATLSRSMISCTEVAEYIKLGFDAAKRGETLEIKYSKVDDL
jgi:hypothetical protein